MQAVRSWVVGLTIAAVSVTFVPSPARAAMIHEMTGPAETPPASYTGNQYVDSRGCLFIRAGRNGVTQWVPRANRQRQVLCGYRPSLQGGARQAAAGQQQVASGQPVRRRNYIEVIPDQQGATARVQTAPRAPVQTQPQPQQRRVVRQSANNPLAWLFGQPRQRQVVRQPQVAVAQPQVQPRVVYQQPQRQVVYRQPQAQVGYGGPFSNPPAGTPVNRPAAVAGNANSPYWTAGNQRGLTVRYRSQQVHPSEYYAAQQGRPRYQAPAAYVTPQAPRVYGQQRQVVAANPYGNSPQAYYWTAGNNRNLAVRYGPQAVHPSDYYVTRQRPATAGYVAGGAGAYGQPVYGGQGYRQAAAQAPVVIPPGYEAVYPEGRLNPNRGVSGGARVQGFGQGAGIYAPPDASSYSADRGTQGYVTPAAPTGRRLMWTSYMPRKLYDVTTGQDVTAMYPELQYPYTDLSLQRQHLSAAGRGTTRRRTGGAAPYVPEAPTIPRSPSMEDDASPVNMSENAAAMGIEDTAASATQSGDVKVFQPSRPRYVQVGTFAQPENATRLQARFEGQGLPTHARPLVRGGTRYNIVLLGPFSDQAQLNAALATARSAGFGDAFTVN